MLEGDDVGELIAVGKNCSGIDLRSAVGTIVGAPAADGIEVFKRESHGIDLAMATGAGFVFAMQLELIADGLGLAQVWRKWLHIRRRRRRRCAENVFQQPHTAHDGRGIDAVGGGGHYRGHGENTAATRIASRNANHAFAGHIVATVHPAGDVGVKESVIGMNEGGNPFVAREHVRKKCRGLLGEHRLHSAVVIKTKRTTLLRRHLAKLIKPQPRGRKILLERLGTRILKHALHLRAHDGRFAQLVFCRESKERLVGHGRPQEITEARGQRLGVEVAGVFAQIQKARRTQQRGVTGLQCANCAGFIRVADNLLRRGMRHRQGRARNARPTPRQAQAVGLAIGKILHPNDVRALGQLHLTALGGGAVQTVVLDDFLATDQKPRTVVRRQLKRILTGHRRL